VNSSDVTICFIKAKTISLNKNLQLSNLFLFNNVIYVFLLLLVCILIVCLCMTTLTEFFTCFFLSCKANARVKPEKTGHGSHSS